MMMTIIKNLIKKLNFFTIILISFVSMVIATSVSMTQASADEIVLLTAENDSDTTKSIPAEGALQEEEIKEKITTFLKENPDFVRMIDELKTKDTVEKPSKKWQKSKILISMILAAAVTSTAYYKIYGLHHLQAAYAYLPVVYQWMIGDGVGVEDLRAVPLEQLRAIGPQQVIADHPDVPEVLRGQRIRNIIPFTPRFFNQMLYDLTLISRAGAETAVRGHHVAQITEEMAQIAQAGAANVRDTLTLPGRTLHAVRDQLSYPFQPRAIEDIVEGPLNEADQARADRRMILANRQAWFMRALTILVPAVLTLSAR